MPERIKGPEQFVSLETMEKGFDESALTEKEFADLTRKIFKEFPAAYRTPEQKMAALETYRKRLNKARERVKQQKERPAAPVPEINIQETATEITSVSLDDFHNLLAPEDWRKIAERLGLEAQGPEALAPIDPEGLRSGDEVLVQPSGSDAMDLVRATFLKRLPPDKDGVVSYRVLSQGGKEMEVLANMLFAPERTSVSAEEEMEELFEIITPEQEQEPQAEKITFMDHVMGDIEMPDGSKKIVHGQFIGFFKTKQKDVRAAIYSDAKNKVVFVKRSALKLFPGETIAHHIAETTGFSPTDVVRLPAEGDKLYHVVGIADTGELELIPGELLESQDIKPKLERIIAIKMSGTDAAQEELEMLQKEVKESFDQAMIRRPTQNVERAKIKESGKRAKKS